MFYSEGQSAFLDAAFIGSTDVDSEGNWAWLDHKPWQFDNFPDGGPNGGDSENCLEMKSMASGNKPAGWWNDIHCSETRGYICSYYNGRLTNINTYFENIPHIAVLCHDDWYLWNGHCYFTANTKATFDTAWQVCKDENDLAELVSIHDEIEDGKLADAEKTMSYIGVINDENSSWHTLY